MQGFGDESKEGRAREMGRTRELILNRLTKVRVLNVAIHGCLCGEDGIEVGHVNRAVDARLEGRVNLLLREQLEVDMVIEERVLLDLLSAIDAKTIGGVACEESRQNAPGLRANFRTEGERVL